MQLNIYQGPRLWQSVELDRERCSLPSPVFEMDSLGVELVDALDEYEYSLAIGDEPIPDSPRSFWDRTSSPPKLMLSWSDQKYFEKYAGLCDICLTAEPLDPETRAAKQWYVGVQVIPSKLTQNEFDQLVESLAHVGRGLLYDIYGRAQLGLTFERRGNDFAPEERLNRLREFVGKVTPVLQRIGRAPAHRVQTAYQVSLYHESVLDVESIRWLTQHPEEIRFVSQQGRNVVFPERILSRAARRDLGIYEHRVIKAALGKSLSSLKTLAALAEREIEVLQEERSWKDQSSEPGGVSWWQEYNVPRIEAARNRLGQIENMRIKIQEALAAHPYLASVNPEPSPAKLTPLFQQHPDYSAVYRSISRMERDASFVPDMTALPVKVRDLPTLYETWCFLQVAAALCLRATPAPNQPMVLVEHGRYTMHIASDRPLIFTCPTGRELRLYCQRRYENRGSAQEGYGRLTSGSFWLPDIALEIFADHESPLPEAIFIFDAKYKSYRSAAAHQQRDWSKMWRYVHEIGSFHDSRHLVKHAWVLSAEDTNIATPYVPTFFSHTVLGQSTVGTIPLRPQFDASQFLQVFDRLLELDGIRLNT